MSNIKIFDTTLRDGEQSPGASLTVAEKVIIAKQLAKLNVDIIEAGFPIASEGDFESVKQIAEKVSGPTICALARASVEDIDRAWHAVKAAQKPRIHTFIATSQIHLDAKLRKTKEEVIAMAVAAIKHAKQYTDDVEFSPEDAARTDLAYMLDVVKAAIEAGATTINIPDTVGYATPAEFGARIKAIFDTIPEAKNVTISCHCHNDLGLAVANSLAAVENGATQVECTVNGIGERAGNAAMEEVVMALKTRADYYKEFQTSINTEEIGPASKLVSELTGLAVQRNKAIVGANAFAHEAGIHQHGVLAAKNTYEIMSPETVGWQGQGIVMGKHSGKHATDAVLKEIGYELTDDQIETITKRIKDLADTQKNILRSDIIAIANDVIGSKKQQNYVILTDISIATGNNTEAKATVQLSVGEQEKSSEATGVGPVNAAAKAILQAIGGKFYLKDYSLKAITGGTDALANVTVVFEDADANQYLAEAVDQDVIMASVTAMIKAINSAMTTIRTEAAV